MNGNSIEPDNGGHAAVAVAADVPRQGFAAGWFGKITNSWRYWIGAAASLGAIAIGAAALHWASSGVPPEEISIAEQWNANIRKLGFEPIYPPVEDIAVGDVLAMVTEDAALRADPREPFARSNLKLLHLDLTSEIEKSYQEMYQFPATSARPAHDTDLWSQQAATGSLFKPPEARTTLPLVIFPHFTISGSRRAGGGGVLSNLWGAALGGNAASSESIDVRISGTETYGIPAYPAEIRLMMFCDDLSTRTFCSDQAVRKQLSLVLGSQIYEQIVDKKTGKATMRYTVELGLVNRVFLARSIETKFSADNSQEAQVGSKSSPPEPLPAATPTSSSANAASASSSPNPTPSTATTSAPVTTAKPSTPSISVQQTSGSGVLLPDTVLQRPVVVGFKSVRFQVK